MYKRFVKPIFDFLLSVMLMPFVVLLVILIAPIIWLDDHGPVFFNAKRRGKNGRTFTMLKFRSMYVNSPKIRSADGSTFCSANDPRVTRVGRVLRKTSLDEIPQILNVLMGHMSFIGPRPTLATRDYSELDEIRKKGLSVRPGITGYAQAYYRNSIKQKKKFELDCSYVDNLSFSLDIKILMKTVKSVLKHENVFVSASSPQDDQQESIV